MEFEFDKEIDALLRQAARSVDAASAADAHLDADAISAFAENALPEKNLQSCAAHLADCARCRKILSNLILLETEKTAAETASSVVKKEKAVRAGAAAWYRKIFAMPNLAYAMGVLALLFSGLIVFIILQSSLRNSSEISQMSEKSMNSNSASLSSAPTASNSNAAMNSNSVLNSAPVYSSDTAASANSATNVSSSNSAANTAANPTTAEPKTLANSTVPKDESRRETADKDLAKTVVPTEPLPTTTAAEEPSLKEEIKPTTENQARSDDKEGALKQAPKPKVALPSLSSTSDAAIKNESEKKSSSKTGETKTVGDKTFNRRNNVWYDAAYGGQSTTNIARGSVEYKKLDSGLRVVIENLGGTVVIVWKNKAYRIQ